MLEQQLAIFLRGVVLFEVLARVDLDGGDSSALELSV